MKEKNVPLYCNRCDKHYTVSIKAIEFVLSQQKVLRRAGNMYVNPKGCFFKMLAQLQRKNALEVVN